MTLHDLKALIVGEYFRGAFIVFSSISRHLSRTINLQHMNETKVNNGIKTHSSEGQVI
jgi:hypothetical protein